ncbi:MAG: magnesium/cobalt transporter CorA [Armatimonadetes bacterium]|nr:magnesium/cobalt transporter CorA [Armatimonadota bacterium]
MIKTYLFTPDGYQEDVPLDDWRSLVEEDGKLLWVDVRSAQSDEITDLATQFGLHSIVVDSLRDGYSRPHLYEFSDHFYVNMTTITTTGRGEHPLRPEELHVVAGQKFMITAVRGEKSEAVDRALAEYKGSPGLSAHGAIRAFYLLAEDLVETYFPVVEKLDDEADKLEITMLDRADKSSLHKLFQLKRQGFELRRLLGPQRDIFNELSRRDFPFITGEDQVYFQDVYNRMIRIFDMMDTVREILSGNLDIYLSTVSNRLNEVMKVLTVFATILMMLAFITGFFGMNFVHLPGLHSVKAFWGTVAAMAVVTGMMAWWFKRKGWM